MDNVTAVLTATQLADKKSAMLLCSFCQQCHAHTSMLSTQTLHNQSAWVGLARHCSGKQGGALEHHHIIPPNPQPTPKPHPTPKPERQGGRMSCDGTERSKSGNTERPEGSQYIAAAHRNQRPVRQTAFHPCNYRGPERAVEQTQPSALLLNRPSSSNSSRLAAA